MVQCHPPLELEELPKEDEERLEKLFSKLDTDGNGKIDIHDLSVALKELAPHINRSYAEVRILRFLITVIKLTVNLPFNSFYSRHELHDSLMYYYATTLYREKKRNYYETISCTSEVLIYI